MTEPAFERRRFRTAAEHYLAGRPPYAAGLIGRVASFAGLGGSDRVLDLGCGPGQLARAFAPLARDVLALDPEPEMLRIARAATRPEAPITWQLGGSEDLHPGLGRFKLVVMGRSFHWMDRDETLRRLATMIEPGGAVALLHDVHPPGPDNRWYEAYRAILRRYAGDDSMHVRTSGPDWVRHENVLLRSAFCRVEEVGVYERRSATVEGLVERALSMSSTSAARLGARATDMVAELRAELPREPFSELVLSQALLGLRPNPAPAAAPSAAPSAATGAATGAAGGAGV